MLVDRQMALVSTAAVIVPTKASAATHQAAARQLIDQGATGRAVFAEAASHDWFLLAGGFPGWITGQPTLPLIEDFAGAVLEGGAPRFTGATALAAERVMDRACGP